MEIYILGLDHEVQTYDGNCTVEKKNNFEMLLRELVSERRIEFIGDETYPERNAISKFVAKSLQVDWEPIEMSVKAREELGIADEQRTQRFKPIFENNLIVGSERVPVLSDGIREEYMMWRTLTKANAAQSILVLCGMEHVDSLGERFKKAAPLAKITLDSLSKRDWYSLPDREQEA